ncbi:uncharacterized protein LOC135502068 isoform X3 [Lineus longissimus]|uniref:uncharacterized protein LOC135502068 isoform X3 n=1 Tax=Lineus longissimus TaxID=88925 RepID=UPI00315DDF71
MQMMNNHFACTFESRIDCSITDPEIQIGRKRIQKETGCDQFSNDSRVGIMSWNDASESRSKLKKMSELSDEDPPALVSTDEEEDIPLKKKPMIGPEIPAALKRDAEVAKDLSDYIKRKDCMKQVTDSLRILVVDPFLFGTDNTTKKYNKAWIAAASQKFGFPQSGENIMHAVLRYENRLAVQLLEKACAEVNDYLSERKLDTLKMFKISDQVRKDYKDDKLVHVDRYSNERVVEDICLRIVKAFPKEDSLNSAAKFAVLYVLNTWTFFANQKFRFDFDVTGEVDKDNLSQTGEESRTLGNEKFKESRFEEAIGHYKRAIEENPHSHVYYGNRAQAYLRLKKFTEAASDGRRAVSLKPDWIKGLYRYAEALFELKFYDEAHNINKQAAEVLKQSGENVKDRDKVEKQRERIRKMMTEDKENKVEPISNKILEKMKEENGKTKKTVENVKNTADKVQKKKKIEIESDDDIPALASAESSSEDDDVTILDRASEIKLNDELKGSKPRDHDEFRMHQELQMERRRRTEKVIIEDKKKKEAERREKIPVGMIRKEKEKERELAEANKKVAPEKKKGPLKTGTCANPVKLQKSSRVNGTDALQSVKKKDIEKLKNLMGMGSQALLTLRSRNAIDHYTEALDFIMSKNLTYFSLDILDMMILKYAHGVALLEAGTLQRILDGIAAFEALLKDYPKRSFPLAYHGIGRGYIKQNRYHDAIEHLDHGLAIVKKNLNLTVLTWPGSCEVMKETPPGMMKESFEDLLYLCRYPPHPDAVCFYTDCHGFYKKEIYFTDPDFQGFVRTVCYAKCMIDFHITCWKKFRTAAEDRHSEKDYLERPCFTPDCYACIVKVLIYDKDGLAKKEITSEIDHRHKKGGNKPKVRRELTNEKKIKRKEEKKALRIQRKMEAKAREEEEHEEDILEELERRFDERQTEESASGTTEDVDSRSHTTGGGVAEEDPLPKEKDMMVLKKELSPGEKYKVVTAKKVKRKKKDKTKTTLSLDEFVNVGRDNAQEDDDEYDPDKPFSVPSQLRPEIEAFENCHFGNGAGDCSVALTPAEEEIVANLYSFFEDHLKATGPVYLHDQTLALVMEDFPPEAKDVIRKYDSLSNFLLQNLKFAMMDEHLCLLKDSAKAKKMAVEKRQQGTIKYQSYSQSVSANSDVPGGPVIHSTGTSLNPTAMEFSPSGTALNSDNSERTRHGDLCDFDLPLAPPLGKTKQRKYSEDEFPTLGDGGMIHSVRSDSASRASLSDSLSSSCDDMKGDVLDSKSGNGDYQTRGGAMEVPPFLSGPPGAAKKKQPQTPRSGSLDKVPPFLSGPPLARNAAGSPRMGSPKRVSPRPPEKMERKRSIADDFKRQVLEKLQKEKMDSSNAFGREDDFGVDASSEIPPSAFGNREEDLAETYQSDSENSLDDLDGVDDVVVRATDTQKLDGEDYDANLDADLNKTFEKAVGKGRSASKTIFDQAPGVSHDPSMYSWNVKEMNIVTSRAPGGNQNNIRKPENDSDSLSHKMQLARKAWSTADQPGAGEYCSFPSVHAGPGFGGSPFEIPTSASFSRETDTNTADKFNSNMGLDDIDDSNMLYEILDSNGDDKHLDNSSRHSDSFTSDVNISTEKDIDQMDEDFVHEFSSSVMDGLKRHSAFADNGNLADLVRSTIEKDLQRCAVSKALNSAMGTHFSGSNSGSTAINKDFLRKPAILCRSIAVQSEPLTRCLEREVQTDPYEPYKLERDALQQQVGELDQMLAQMKNVCNQQRLRYGELKDSYEDAKKHLVNLNSLNSENEHEKLQLKHECHNAQEEIRRIKEQLHQSQAQEQSILMRMNEQQQTMNDITQQKQEEVERMTAERNLHINIIRQLETNVQQTVATARAAEVELLEFKLDIGMQLMDKHMKDADHYFTNLQAVVKKFEDGNHPIPQQLLTSVEQWQKTKDLIRETAQNCTQSFQEQIQSVKEGTMLASLPKLDLPRAPPPPDQLPLHILRPPMGIQFNPGQAPGQQQMSPTELRNSPSPTTQLLGPVPQSLPSFAQMPKQPPGMQAGGRPGAPPGGRPPNQGPVPSGNLQQAQAQQEQSPTTLFPPQLKPTATVNQTGAYSSAAKVLYRDAGLKRPPGFQGPSAGPPGMGLPSQPPLGGPGAAQGPPSLAPPKKTAAPKNSFEKIMVNLAKMFPNYKRQQLMGFVQKLRTVRSGSLTGMTLDDIIFEVANMILENNPGAVSSVKGQGGASGLATFNDSGSSSPSSGLSGNQTPISIFEDEDPCVICHEEMTPGTFVSLDCHHVFHDECIRKWLQEQRTCPTCRKYALLSDEFPSLG